MDIEKMDYNELLDYLTGQAILKLGRGASMRDIVWSVFEATARWHQTQEKKSRKK